MFVAKNKANQLIRAEQASTLEVYYCQSCKEKVRLSNEPFKVFKHKRGSKCNKNIQKLSLWHYLMDQRLKELLVDKVMFTNRHPFEHTKKQQKVFTDERANQKRRTLKDDQGKTIINDLFLSHRT